MSYDGDFIGFAIMIMISYDDADDDDLLNSLWLRSIAMVFLRWERWLWLVMMSYYVGDGDDDDDDSYDGRSPMMLMLVIIIAYDDDLLWWW